MREGVMAHRHLVVAAAVVAALVALQSVELRHARPSTGGADGCVLIGSMVLGGPCAFGAEDSSGARTAPVQIAAENAAVPPAERAAPADAGGSTRGAEGAPRARGDGGGAATTAGSPGTNPAPRGGRMRQDAGDLIAQALTPIDDMIRENGVAFRASHFAEDCRDWDPEGYGYYQGHASRFVFAIEATDGKVSEYSVCAAAGPDGQCGLYVSVCEYHVVAEQRTGKDGKPEVRHSVAIDRIYLVKPNALSLALRAQMLDELSQGNFMRAYQQYVRQKREGQPAESVTRPWLQKGAR